MANKEFSSVQAEGKSVVIYCRDDYARQKVKELEDTYKAAISDKVVPCQSLPQQPITGKEKWVYRVAGTTSFSDYMWDADATPAGWILMSTSDHGIDEEPTPGSTNLAESGGIFAWGNRTFSKPFGFYDGMTVGTSRNLLGKATVTETFWKKILGTGIAKGLGYVDKVQGESVAWGQLVEQDYSNFNKFRLNFSLSDGVATCSAQQSGAQLIFAKSNFIVGHVYYTKFYYKGATGYIYINGTLYKGGTTTENDWVKAVSLRSFPQNAPEGNNIYAVIEDTPNFYVKDYVVIDLTAIGIDNLTTAEEVEAWLAAHPGEADYYAYDAGSLLSVKMQNVKTVGFNRWDEEWDSGLIDSVTGINTAGNAVRSKNYIPVIPGGTYYYHNGSNIAVSLFYYDANQNYLGFLGTCSNGRILTFNSNVRFIRFYTFSAYGTTYKNDICINFSNSALNGTYMPYQATTRPLDVTNITGINPTTGIRERIFTDGMRSAGTAHDEIVVESGAVKAIQRVGSVDLGSLTFGYYTQVFYYTFGVGHNKINENLICALYKTLTKGGLAQREDKAIWWQTSNDCTLIVQDSSYSDAATFKTAMSGVLLFYELAEPVVYTDLQDADGNPIFMPLGIPVEPLGTLEVLPENTEGEALTMCAPTLTLRMSIDAVHLLTDEVPATYQTYAIDKQNMNALVAAINQHLGATMGGTFGVVENADKSLSITFTAASNNQNE